MDIYIEAGEQESYAAAGRGDIVIVIDALRASVTIATALARGCSSVIPVALVEEARQFLGKNGYFVAGERDGVKIPDFDFGNSPTAMVSNAHQLLGQTLVLTTTNGTQSIQKAHGATEILIGSMVNLSSAIKGALVLGEQHQKDICLLPAGQMGEPAIEDSYVAAVMYQQLYEVMGSDRPLPADIAELLDRDPVELFKTSSSGQILQDLGDGADVLFCTQRDLFDVVPRLEGDKLESFDERQYCQYSTLYLEMVKK